MPAVARVQTSSATIFSGAGAAVEDSGPSSRNFMDVLDKVAGSTNQKSANAPKAESKPAASATQTSKSAKKSKPVKVRKDDDSAPVEQAESNSTAKTEDASGTSLGDGSTSTDTRTDSTTAVANDGESDSKPQDAAAQLAAYAAVAQTPTIDTTGKATQSKADVPARSAQKVQPQVQVPKIAPNVHAIDASKADEAATDEIQAKDAQEKAPVNSQLSQDPTAADAASSNSSARDAIDQLKSQASADQASAAKAQAAPKPAARQGSAFGKRILPDARVDVSSNATSGNDAQAKGSTAAPAQTSQPVDVDALISVNDDAKGRPKLGADDQSDGKDSALDIAPQAPPKVAHAPLPPVDKPLEARFAEVNHPEIVNNIRGQLLPNGGSMQLRLDPPDLGRLDVTVTVKDGVMSAAFATANDQATRLLSHSLGQLKTALESAGVTVEKLQVQQSPKSQGGDTSDTQQHPHEQQDPSARQEQQRREILERMWERISMGPDDVDVKG
jgi:flagellar hook-length control protein FliK